jgi:hypothetical protein
MHEARPASTSPQPLLLLLNRCMQNSISQNSTMQDAQSTAALAVTAHAPRCMHTTAKKHAPKSRAVTATSRKSAMSHAMKARRTKNCCTTYQNEQAKHYTMCCQPVCAPRLQLQPSLLQQQHRTS